MNLAVIWDSWGQYGLALQYGERGIASGAASAQAYETMGRILLHQNEPAEALSWYRRSLEFGPGAVLLANIGLRAYADYRSGKRRESVWKKPSPWTILW